MHDIIRGCAAALILACAIPANAWNKDHRPCIPPPNGITSWWPGDGNGADIVGGRTATFVDNATTAPGLVGKAFTLDGDGDFIEVPPDPGLDFGRKDFTIMLWVRFNTSEREQVLIERWAQKFGPPSIGWTLTKLEDNTIRLALGPQAPAAGFDVDTPPLQIDPNVWIQVAARRSRNHFSVLINGKEVASGNADEHSPFVVHSDSSLKFGHRCSPSDTPDCFEERGGFFLNGQIDEVQLFIGRAVPDGLIRAIYLAGARGECKTPRLDDRDDDHDHDHDHEHDRDHGEDHD